LTIPCEVAVKSVIPAVRALLAKELVEKHGMKQNQVAEILGISQSAVSKYNKKVRGYVIRIEDLEEIQTPINALIDQLVNEKPQRTQFLNLFCQTCLTIRKKGLMCQLCRKTDPRIEECDFCLIHCDSKRK